jgi:ClpP class serine protease
MPVRTRSWTPPPPSTSTSTSTSTARESNDLGDDDDNTFVNNEEFLEFSESKLTTKKSFWVSKLSALVLLTSLVLLFASMFISVCTRRLIFIFFISLTVYLVTKPKTKTKETLFSFTMLNESTQADADNLVAFLSGKAKLPDSRKFAEDHHAYRRDKLCFVFDFGADAESTAQAIFLSQVVQFLVDLGPEQVARVLVRVDSTGGSVTAFGHSTDQLMRLGQHGIPLTACVDKHALSGGYMMASVADTICAGPMAMVGSIGVGLEFHNGIEHVKITAGTNKRTVGSNSPITQGGIDAEKNKVLEFHQHFKDHVSTHRPQADISRVTDGSHWMAWSTVQQKMGLVDRLATSEDVIQDIIYTEGYRVIEISPKKETSITMTKMLKNMSSSVKRSVKRTLCGRRSHI